MRIGLLALDLDDTLLKRDLSISPRNRRALKKAEKRGVIVVLASGRIPHSMQRYVRELDMHRREGFLIANNGATIQRTDTHEVTAAHLMPAGLCAEVHAFLAGRGFPLHLYGERTLYASADNAWADLDCRMTCLEKAVMPDIAARYERGCAKFVVPGEPAGLRGLMAELRQAFAGRVNVLISKPYFLEVLPPEADKGLALAELAGLLSIPRDAVMAMGDSLNDRGMIEYAGWGVAMANALPEIKAAARLVSERSHEDDGVAEVIEKYII